MYIYMFIYFHTHAYGDFCFVGVNSICFTGRCHLLVEPSRKISIPGLGDAVAGPTLAAMIPGLVAFRTLGKPNSNHPPQNM